MFGWFKRKQDDEPRISEAYKLVDRAYKLIYNAGAILEDTQDFERMRDDDKDHFRKLLVELYKKSEFQTHTLRDELILAFRRIPNTRIKRK